ncbi:MAG: hypothetical protein ABI162_06410 [Luteolibacter sp.]
MKNNPSRLKARHFITAAAVALLTVACDRQVASTSHGTTRHPQQHAAAKVFSPPPALPGAAAFNWHPGDTSSFTLEVGFAFGPAADDTAVPDPAKGGLVISGNYHLGVLSVEGDTVTLAAALSDGKILRGGERSPIFENLVNSTPAVLTLAKDGTLQRIAFPADVPTEDRQILRAIFGWEFQARSGAASWTSKETVKDTGGSFLATYTANGDGSVTKVRSFIPGEQGPEQKVEASHFAGRAGRCGLDYLRGQEITTVILDGKTAGESLIKVSLERSAPGPLPELVKSMLRSIPRPGEFTEEPTAAAARRLSAAEQIRIAMLRQKYRAVPYELLFGALEKVSNTGSHADALQALHDFRDLLLVRPDLAPRVAESLKSGISPQLSALLAHALELANTEATQHTLADILSHPHDFTPPVLAQAIVAAGGLGQLKDPEIAEALDQIQSQFGDTPNEIPLNEAALFSLSRLATANPELQEPLIAALTPYLAGSNDEDRCSALLALTNARLYTPDLLGRAENLLASPEPQTRSAALAYFEHIPELSPGQTQAVANLLRDANVSVQVQAVDTLSAAYQRAPRPDILAELAAVAGDASASADVREAARRAMTNASSTAAK